MNMRASLVPAISAHSRVPGVINAGLASMNPAAAVAELVAVRVGQDVPAPSGLADRLIGQERGAKAQQPLQFRLKVASTQVQVHPVLAVLTLGDPLQQDL